MPTPREQAAHAQLAQLLDPVGGQTWTSSGQVKRVAEVDGRLEVDLCMALPCRTQHAHIREAVAEALGAQVQVRQQVGTHAVRSGVELVPGVRNIVAVASGKGGVGKSTTAANLALALQHEGARVGLLDADIYGPSVPLMLGVSGQRPESKDGKSMEPVRGHGLQINSIGFMVAEDQAVAWRGPMATGALEQMLRQTNWDDLDYLIVDLPPGTGDIQLTLAQRVPVTGAVIVTTPQDMALIDAKKAVRLFEKVDVPVLGLVENMAVYCCPQCGYREAIFGADGGKALAAQFGLHYLGDLPLQRGIRELSDAGTPPVVAAPDGEVAKLYLALARQVARAVAERPLQVIPKFPTIRIEKGV